MEITESTSLANPQIIQSKKQVVFDEANFKPKGAVAFFVVLVLLCLAFWFGIYFLMLGRV